jgi:hypothetical protein
MSFVFNSFGNPVKDRMRVTDADSPGGEVAIGDDRDLRSELKIEELESTRTKSTQN